MPARVAGSAIVLPVSAALTSARADYPLTITTAVASDTRPSGPATAQAPAGGIQAAGLSDPAESDQAGFVETQTGTASNGTSCATIKNWDVPQSGTDGNGVGFEGFGPFCIGVYQSYYMFDTSGLTSAMQVISASLTLSENYSASHAACSSTWVLGLYSLGSSNTVIGQNTTANNEPALNSGNQLASANVPLASNPQSPNNCPQRTVTYDVTANMTRVARFSDNFWNYGIQDANTTNEDAFSRYGNDPNIITTFDLVPPAPAYQVPSPAPVDHPGKTDMGCGSTTPWIGATSSITLRADFEPASGLPNDQVETNWSWSVGTNDSVTIGPSGREPHGSYSQQIPDLVDGGQYNWQAGTTVNHNGTPGDSGFTTWGPDCTFVLDLTPPAVPAVASTAFPPSGAATGTSQHAPASGAFSFASTDPVPATCGSNGIIHLVCQASGVYEFEYSLNQPLPANLLTPGCSANQAQAVLASTDANGNATAASCPVAVPNWGTNILYVAAVDNAGNISQSYQYAFYVPWNPKQTVTSGDVNGDGIPDLLATTTTGNLLLYPGGSDPALTPSTASVAADSPDGTGWNTFQITHRGSWSASQFVDDLFALKGSNLYRYLQNTTSGAAPQFENTAKVRLAFLPPCNAGGDPDNPSNCTGYPSNWSGVSQILAPGDAWSGAPAGTGIANDTTDPSLLAVDPSNGTLWLFQGNAGGQLQNPVQLGSSGWNGMTIIAPGAVGGTNRMWARQNSTGTLYSYPFAVDPASGIPTLNPASAGTPIAATDGNSTGAIITGVSLPQSSYPTVTSLGSLTGGACSAAGDTSCPALYAEDTSGNLLYFPGQPVTGGAPPLTGNSQLVGSLDASATFAWSLADGSGGTAADGTGNGHAGTLNAGVSWGTDPVRGTVAQLDGAAGAVTASSAVLSIGAGHSFSVTAWVNPSAATTNQDALSQDGTNVSGFHLGSTAAGVWAFRRALTDTATVTYATAKSTSAVQTNTWTFLAGTYDATTGSLDLYVNGALVAAAIDPTPFPASGPTVAGRGLFGGSHLNWWHGNISAIEGFNYSLSPAQIAAINNGQGQISITQLS